MYAHKRGVEDARTKMYACIDVGFACGAKSMHTNTAAQSCALKCMHAFMRVNRCSRFCCVTFRCATLCSKVCMHTWMSVECGAPKACMQIDALNLCEGLRRLTHCVARRAYQNGCIHFARRRLHAKMMQFCRQSLRLSTGLLTRYVRVATSEVSICNESPVSSIRLERRDDRYSPGTAHFSQLLQNCRCVAHRFPVSSDPIH